MRLLLIAAIALSAVGFASLSPARAAEPEITLRVVGGLAGQPIYTEKEAPFWQSRIVVATGGRLKGEITPFNRGGIRAEEMLNLIRLGVVPFGTTHFGSTFLSDPLPMGYDLPGLNSDFAALRAHAAAFRPAIEARLRDEYDLELLAVYTYPAQVVFCAARFADLSQLAGRRFRVSGAAMSHMIEALGGLPVIVPFAQIVESVQKGVVDCVITGAMSGNILGLHRVTTHISPIPFTYGPIGFLANGAAWRRIPKELQDIVRAELVKFEAEVWDMSEEATREGISCNTGADTCAHGERGTMKLVPTSAADQRRLQDLLWTAVLPDWVARCSETCRSAWNRTIGLEIHMAIP